MSKKKVLAIVFNDLRNDNRVLNQAFSLASDGHDVTLMGIARETSLPANEQVNGVKIIRKRMTDHPIYQIRKVRYIALLLSVCWQIVKESRSGYDVVHCHDLRNVGFGVLLKLLSWHRTTLIYDAHEYETQRNGLHGWRQRYVKVQEWLLIRFCDRVVTVSETIAEEYARLYGIEKPVVVLNCPVLRSREIIRRNLFRERFSIPASTRIFLYQGYLFPGRGVEVMLEAFDRLNLPNGALVFMGEGELADTIRRHPRYGKSVFLHPFVSGDVLLDYTSSADFGLSFIEDISLSDRYCLPNKLFEYIAAGLPVISSGLPDLTRFITAHKVGVAAPSNDVAGFIQAFNNLPDLDSVELKQNISRTRASFNWGTQEQILFDLYDSL